MTTVEDFTENYLEIRENVVLSRVELVIKDQHLQITLDRENKGQDLFVNVLGFATTQTLHSPAQASSSSLRRTWHRSTTFTRCRLARQALPLVSM